MAIYIEDEGIKKVFAGGPDITIAGNGVPRGFARPVDGGYMIRGNWAYGSGIQHAEWVHSGCFVTDAIRQGHGDRAQRPAQDRGHPSSALDHQADGQLGRARPARHRQLRLHAERGRRTVRADAHDLRFRHRCAAPRRHAGRARPRRLQRLGAFRLGGRRRPPHARRTRQGDRPARSDPFGKSSDSASFKFQFAQAEARFRAARAFVYETWRGRLRRPASAASSRRWSR